MTKEQPVTTKIMRVFPKEEIQHCVLGHLPHLCFLKHKLAIEVDEKWHKDRDEDKDRERQKAIEELGFIRINPDNYFSIFLLILVKYTITLLNLLKN